MGLFVNDHELSFRFFDIVDIVRSLFFPSPSVIVCFLMK